MIYIFGAAFDPPHAGHNAIIRALLHYKNPEKIILMPSGKRNDKSYHVSEEHRKAMVDIFVNEINGVEKIEKIEKNEKTEQIPRSSEWQKQGKVVADYHFLDTFTDEMITRDADIYARKAYSEDIIHVFGTDTIASMLEWDSEQYAVKVVKKLFVPRYGIGFDGVEQLDNYEFFTDSHFPDISSTQVREDIRAEYRKHIAHTKDFTFPGLSKPISQHILTHRLYWKSPEKKEKLLIHVCCGPDVTMPILELKDEYDILCYWYDPNIEPKAEYDKRFAAFEKVCEIENIPFIKGAYDVKRFHKQIAGLEHTPEKGEKCTKCYDMRLHATAKLAKKLGIQKFTTSLNTSPKKDLEKIFALGDEHAREFDLKFLSIPFRKNGGFERSVAYTKKHNIYRQNYCGCAYSIREGGGRG